MGERIGCSIRRLSSLTFGHGKKQCDAEIEQAKDSEVMGLVYSYLYLVLNFASFSDLGLAIMGLDLVSFTVLDLGLAAVGFDLVSFLSMYSKTE